MFERFFEFWKSKTTRRNQFWYNGAYEDSKFIIFSDVALPDEMNYQNIAIILKSANTTDKKEELLKKHFKQLNNEVEALIFKSTSDKREDQMSNCSMHKINIRDNPDAFKPWSYKFMKKANSLWDKFYAFFGVE